MTENSQHYEPKPEGLAPGMILADEEAERQRELLLGLQVALDGRGVRAVLARNHHLGLPTPFARVSGFGVRAGLHAGWRRQRWLPAARRDRAVRDRQPGGVSVTSWQERAAVLAADIAGPGSGWLEAVRRVPRHVLVPRWFTRSQDGAWVVRDGPSGEPAWLDAAYDGTTSLVTRVGSVHADHAEPDARYEGWPASSATMPRLVLDRYRRARLYEGASILDVGTGSGHGAALLAARYGDGQVTRIDVDDYLTSATASRLAGLGLHPAILACDAAGDLPGTFDRIVPMVSLPAIPASWLAALRPDGRLVFSLAGGPVLITARKTPDGGAAGRVEFERAGFMTARHDCPPQDAAPGADSDADGDDITTSPYPVVDPAYGWELDAVLSVTTPGLSCSTSTSPDTGITTTRISHPDGSWARASGRPGQPATVCQAGPRRLWDILDAIRADWLNHGYLPLWGAHATIEPDGTCHLSKGHWHATIAPQDTP